ncbi:hypothetical protein JHK87_055757 [Glycine soja]|nr:hypothetical protein JHK87_055757 [Glycine soja]
MEDIASEGSESNQEDETMASWDLSIDQSSDVYIKLKDVRVKRDLDSRSLQGDQDRMIGSTMWFCPSSKKRIQCTLSEDVMEETYVWVLEQFLDVMKGKAPASVIIDDDLTIQNAIKRVFSIAHRRLYAWHLMRNATSHVHVNAFMPKLKRCMLGDFDDLWVSMIKEFHLVQNNWLKELYEKRMMWATLDIRGCFFTGRITSRCKAFHSHLGNFVNPQICLFEFVEQYQRCLCYFLSKEREVDYDSKYGNVVP